jgi:hypothetical protein
MLVGPRVQVNPVKGDSLRANSDHGEEGAHFAIEAIFVHP